MGHHGRFSRCRTMGAGLGPRRRLAPSVVGSALLGNRDTGPVGHSRRRGLFMAHWRHCGREWRGRRARASLASSRDVDVPAPSFPPEAPARRTPGHGVRSRGVEGEGHRGTMAERQRPVRRLPEGARPAFTCAAWNSAQQRCRHRLMRNASIIRSVSTVARCRSPWPMLCLKQSPCETVPGTTEIRRGAALLRH